MIGNRLLAVAGGAASALLYLAVLGGTPGAVAVTIFTQLPLMLVALSLGLGAAVIAGVTASVAVAAAAGPLSALDFAALRLLPALLVAWLALRARTGPDGVQRWYPPGTIVGWVCAAGLAGVVLSTALGPPPELAKFFHLMIGRMAESMPNPPPKERLDRVVHMALSYYPGIMATVLGWTVLMNAALAQRMAQQFGRNIRPAPSYRTIELPSWLGAAVVASGLGVFLSGQMGVFAANVLIVVLAPFLFLGLAVIHAISVGWPGRAAALVLVYLLLFLFAGLAAPVLTVLGLLEHYFRFRRRHAGSGQGREEE